MRHGKPIALILAFCAIVTCAPAQDREEPVWPDIFPNLGMYAVKYAKPVVGKGEKPEAYQQKATYEWSGGRFEILEITLARDPAFKERYAAATVQKEKNPPKELEMRKKKAWLWEFPRDPANFRQVVRRLVVVVDADKALIIDQIGMGPGPERVAERFDFAKIEKALANPPKQ
jgi:hypothetical protein